MGIIMLTSQDAVRTLSEHSPGLMHGMPSIAVLVPTKPFPPELLVVSLMIWKLEDLAKLCLPC